MKIAWSSNSPHLNSGYATQTRLIIERLAAAGHQVAVLATFGIRGTMIQLGNICVYPESPTHQYGQDMVGPYSRHFGADITVNFLDAWILRPDLYGSDVRSVMMFPVDSDPVQPRVVEVASQAWARITYSQFGYDEALRNGLSSYCIPHGFDPSVYYPMDKQEARKKLRLGLPNEDTFLIGVVAANHDPLPTRKAWEQIFQGYRIFRDTHPQGRNSRLYLHTFTRMAVDLNDLANFFGVFENIITCDQLQNMVGFGNDHMRHTFNAFDVLLAPSTGEGACLPLLEAAGCATPTITGAWTAMTENWFAGVLIPKERAHFYWTNNRGGHYMVEPEAVADALSQFLDAREFWPDFADRALMGSRAHHIDKIFIEKWLPALAEMEAKVIEENEEKRRVRPAKADPKAYTDEQLVKAMDKISPPRVVLVNTSHGEECGIAEFNDSCEEVFDRAGIPTQTVERVDTAIAIARNMDSVKHIVIQHEYVMFDERSDRLGRGELTEPVFEQLADLKRDQPDINISWLIHTVSPRPFDQATNSKLQRAALAGHKLYTTTMQGAEYLGIDFLPLGAWPIEGWTHEDRERTQGDPWIIGNFGFYGRHRDIPSQMELCKATDSHFLGSFACNELADRGELEHILRGGVESGLKIANVWTDYVDDLAVMERLSQADILYMPRPDVGLFYSSASVLTALNARRPIIINKVVCYADLLDTLTVVTSMDEAIAAVERLKDPCEYAKAVAKIEAYCERRRIDVLWKEFSIAS